ncbi:MAG: monofunctional biosynthetic peptidoglycan transglycosylase [Deltaproteobacteria bacterium]|nr:MAG: monofunctional biosynthetic peptidoglycan transglycosylase [Deltaproteobacteria bacterium]TNF27674.1 MAG: monofunctional biosynthetic peptidoglycan transglycosylase [Deltaproteobacteria bacterium]
MSKKYMIPLTSFVSLLLMILIVWLMIVPRSDIKKLSKGYVEIKWENGQVNYTITDKKPASWVSLDQISKKSYQAIVISEDWAFFNHDGVDVNQLKKATQDMVEGKRTRGASTISQQVVKNLFLTPEKTMTRKLKEVLITLYLEQNLSKEKILEVYLNIIEYGEGTYGIKKAAQLYFNKPTDKLSAREGAFLAMLLPNPKRHAESFRKKSLTPFAKKIVDDVLQKMKMAKFIDENELESQASQTFFWEKVGSGTGAAAILDSKGNPIETSSEEMSGAEGGTIHEKLRDKLENTTEQVKKNLPPGETFEKKYREDRETIIGDEPDYDPDALIEDESGLEEEFRVD